MAQCHAERRKHPSAMDFYVGALHSKLYSSSRDVDKYPLWPNPANAPSTSPSSSCTSFSQSYRKDPSAGSRPSAAGGSFRASTLMVGPGAEVKTPSNLSYTALSVKTSQNKLEDAKVPQSSILSLANINNSSQHVDSAAVSKCCSVANNVAASDKATTTPIKASNISSNKVDPTDALVPSKGNAPHHSQSGMKEARSSSADCAIFCGNDVIAAASAGVQSSKGNTGDSCSKHTVTLMPNRNEQVAAFPRIHKSAELGIPFINKRSSNAGAVDPASRLFKSGEQVVSKFRLNAGNTKDCLSGGLVVGSQKAVGIGSGESSSSNGGNSSAAKDCRRWSSADSSGSPDLLPPPGGNFTAKDGGKKVCSTSGSSDGAIPMAKDVQSSDFKDAEKRSNVLSNKDLPIARGMGNILVGASNHGTGKGKCTSYKLGVSDAKSGDSSSKKAEDSVPILNTLNFKAPVTPNGCADGMLTRSRGSLNHGNRNISVPSGNILNSGMAPRTHSKQVEETRNASSETVDPEDIKNSGNVQYKLGNFAEAVALYDKSIAMCPHHAPYRGNRAAALAGLGRLGEAVLECEEAVKLDPHYSRAHQRAAHLYLRLGLIESAKRHFHAVGGKDDTGIVQVLQAVEKHISRCIEARKIGDWRKVLRESNEAVACGADSAAQVLGYKSEALLKLHRLEDAATICAEAQRRESSLQKVGVALADSFLHMLRAHIEMQLGKFDGAIEAAQAAIKIDPRNSEAVGLLRKARAVDKARALGNELFKSGKFFEACAVYGEGLESDSTNAVLLCNRAACRSKLGQWEKAIEDCDAALVAQPNYIKALMRRAHCSTKLERWDDALQDYEVLRAKMPSDMEVARGYFDVQVALRKSRGEEIHKMRFGREVEEVYNEDQLREVVTFAGISVVQFITRWSDRCCQISPFIDQLCKQFPCVHFVKVDVEDHPYLAEIESVTFVPTFRIYRGGQRVKELQGPSEQALEHAVKHYSL